MCETFRDFHAAYELGKDMYGTIRRAPEGRNDNADLLHAAIKANESEALMFIASSLDDDGVDLLVTASLRLEVWDPFSAFQEMP